MGKEEKKNKNVIRMKETQKNKKSTRKIDNEHMKFQTFHFKFECDTGHILMAWRESLHGLVS